MHINDSTFMRRSILGSILAFISVICLLTAGTFTFFAFRIDAINSFLDKIVANQEAMLADHDANTKHMNDQDAVLAAIKKHCDTCKH